jgi:general secretion pathway protein D
MQRHRFCFPLALLLSAIVAGAAVAQAPAPAPAPVGPSNPAQPPVPQPIYIVPAPQAAPPPAGFGIGAALPRVELAPLLRRVERAANKRFLLDPRLGTEIYLGGVESNDVTYPVLLAILRLNGFAAFESEGFVNVVPDQNIRFHAPVVQTDDESIPADLYVTRVLTPVNVATPQLVPILRPLLPQSAHLSAHADVNKLIVMDRYENVKRISEIVRSLDVPPR